jgi:hypothetical protein
MKIEPLPTYGGKPPQCDLVDKINEIIEAIKDLQHSLELLSNEVHGYDP